MSTIATPPVDPAYRPNRWRLALAQLLSGVGVASGVAVGAVLVEEISGSTDVAGFSATATILGAGLLAYPLARLASRAGRRAALTAGFGLGALGAVLVLVGVQTHLTLVLFTGLLLFGAATASGLQARYAATDLAPPDQRGTAMAVVVWAATVGSVLGPQLSEPGARLGQALGLNHLVGPYLFSLTSFVLAAAVAATMHRPRTPLRDAASGREASLAQCLRVAGRQPLTLLGMGAVVAGHMMMTSVMSMTPLHMHHQDLSIALVGVVISLHILGMYALSPVVGWLTDRWGPQRVIVLGMVIFAAAFVGGILDAVGESALARLIPALFLLGVGWSCTLIAGSTLLAQSVDAEIRVSMQGAVDTVMNLGAALITAFSGVVLRLGGFVAINLMAAVVLAVLVVVALRARGTTTHAVLG